MPLTDEQLIARGWGRWQRTSPPHIFYVGPPPSTEEERRALLDFKPESWGDRTTPLDEPVKPAPQPPRSLWERLDDESA